MKTAAPAPASSSSDPPGDGYSPNEDQTDANVENVAVTIKPSLDESA